MRKIAFIIQHLTNGGAERTISNLTLELQSKYDVTLIVFDGTQITYPYAGKLIDVGLPPVEGKINKLINMLRRVYRVKKIRKKYKFDTVVSFMFGGNIVNVLSQIGEKVIISARNYMSIYGLSKKDICRERFVLERSDLEISLSKMVEHDLITSFGLSANKIRTIYNPCDTERIKKLSEDSCNYTFDPDVYYFVTAGRMVKQKGQWHLIKAFSVFAKTNPKSKLIMLGDGELKEQLVELCEKLNVSDKVEFIGFVDNPYAYISRASCFVLPSLFEGLGNVIIESMACNTMVISYDCLAGPRELIAPYSDISKVCEENEWAQYGILVPLADSSNVDFSESIEKADLDLSNAMQMAFDDPDRASQTIKMAQTRINEFSPDKIIAEWEKVL